MQPRVAVERPKRTDGDDDSPPSETNHLGPKSFLSELPSSGAETSAAPGI